METWVAWPILLPSSWSTDGHTLGSALCVSVCGAEDRARGLTRASRSLPELHHQSPVSADAPARGTVLGVKGQVEHRLVGLGEGSCILPAAGCARGWARTPLRHNSQGARKRPLQSAKTTLCALPSEGWPGGSL